MALILFIVFIICDLMIVPICWYTYGKQGEYREGMVLGVHIPPECVSHPEVSDLCSRSVKNWKRFQAVNFAVSLLICFLCFWNFTVFILVWMIWIAEYILGLEYLIIVPHRRMYRIKLDHGWIDESRKRIVRIDTAVSAAAEKLVLDWKYHLPILIMTALTVFLVWGTQGKYRMSSGEMLVIWALYGSGVGVCVLFLVFHIWITRAPNRVYSERTEVNLAVNCLTKRAWTEGCAAASWLNGIAWIWMSAVYFFAGPELSGFEYLIYGLLITIAAAGFLVPVIRSVGKRKELLEADPSPFYVDDDEYWKYGWYNNPNDRRILVQDRFNSMNYTTNFGRPGVKRAVIIFTTVITVSCAALVVWVVSILAAFDNAEVVFAGNEGTYSFEAAGYSCEFEEEEIRSVSLIESMPDDKFTRTNGGDTEKVDIGHFRGKSTGKCMMFIYKKYTPILEIKLEDMTVFANSRDAQETEGWYEELSAQLQS